MKILIFSLFLLFGLQNSVHALKIVTSIPPLWSLARQLTEGISEPILLLKGQQSPHTYNLTPSTARLIHEADILFWIGPELETFLKKPLKALTALHVPLIETAGLKIYPLRQGEDWHVEAHKGAGHDHHHDHSHEGKDPHIWLDVQNALAMAGRMKEVLLSRDPDHQELYEKNYARLKVSLEKLQTLLLRETQKIEGSFMVYHDSLQYFEKDYGLSVAGVVAVIPDLQPNLKHLQALRKTIEAKKVRCLFSESEFSPALIKRLSEQTDIPHRRIDPLGLSHEGEPELYQEMMKELLKDFQTCGK